MGINNNINITNLAPKMQKILQDYGSEVTEKVKKLSEEIAKDLTKKTKKDSPVKTGIYKKHITYKKTRDIPSGAIYTWYVKDPEYRLTHLISNGHAKKNGGRTKSNEYLSKNVIESERKFVKGVKEIIENER